MLLWRPPQRECSHQLLAANSAASPQRIAPLTLGRRRPQKFPVVIEGMLCHPADQSLIVGILQSESVTRKRVEDLLFLVFLKFVDQCEPILRIRLTNPFRAIFGADRVPPFIKPLHNPA